jgi:hypothetical protein
LRMAKQQPGQLGQLAAWPSRLDAGQLPANLGGDKHA